MIRWDLIGSRCGECLRVRPRLRRIAACTYEYFFLGPIEIAGVLWKTAWILFFAFLALFALVQMAVSFAPSSFALQAVAHFDVDAGFPDVTIDRQPHDCDWGSAPLGDKHCHYDATVRTVRIGTAKGGGRLVSYDDGKTWNIDAARQAKPSVWVSWAKVDE